MTARRLPTIILALAAARLLMPAAQAQTNTPEITISPSPSPSPAVSPGDVIINEVMWAGSTASDADQWIELLNKTNHDINLGGCVLERAATSGSNLNIAPNKIIPAKSFYVISNFKSSDSRSDLANATNWDTTTLNFYVNSGSNINGNVILKCGSTTLDSAKGDQWPAGFRNTANDIFRSMQRKSDSDGLDKNSWYSCSDTSCGGSKFWKTIEHNFGTPGSENSQPNEAPEAVITAPGSADVGEAVNFSAEESADADGDSLMFTWDFGDKSLIASGSKVTHAFTVAGTYVVTLTASDSKTTSPTTHNIIIGPSGGSNSVYINELLPNPAGSDADGEFIEIYNSGVDKMDLSGWFFDNPRKKFTFATSTSIAPKEYKVFMYRDSKLSLKNTGDTIRLLSASGNVISNITYPSSVPEGQSYSRDDNGAFNWSTTVTRGEKNIITIAADDDTDDAEEVKTSLTPKTSPLKTPAVATKKTLAELAGLKLGTLIQTDGVVSAPPGTFSAQNFYLAGSGILVYMPKSVKLPSLSLGDRVSIKGVLAQAYGEREIKLSQAADIKKTAAGSPPAPHLLKINEINAGKIGWLVVTQGVVSSSSGDTFYINDGTGELKIYIDPETKINKPRTNKGTRLTITGIISNAAAGLRLKPRYQTDILPGNVAAAQIAVAKAVGGPSSPQAASQKNAHQKFPAAGPNIFLLVTKFLLLVVAVLLVSAIHYKEPLLRTGK